MDRTIRISEILEFLDQIEENYSFTGNKDDFIQAYSSFMNINQVRLRG